MPSGTAEQSLKAGRSNRLLPPAITIEPTRHLSALAAYSMYMILSIFCDAAGAVISFVFHLPVAPHFGNPCES